MRKIIVPVDFSESSENALSYAMNLAKEMDAILEIIHVYHPDASAVDSIPSNPSSEEQRSRDQLDDLVNALQTKWFGQAPRLSIQSKFLVGFAGDELIEISKEVEEPIIVMGSSGTSASVKKLFGSVTTKVALYAKCPVYIIPPNTSYQPLSNVVYGSKMEAIDTQVAHKVINLIKADKPTVHLLHIGIDGNGAMDNLLEVWKQSYPDGLVKEVQIPLDDESKVINEYCEQHDADLLVITRKERSFLQDVFHKSVTKALVISTTKPLLVLHSDS